MGKFKKAGIASIFVLILLFGFMLVSPNIISGQSQPARKVDRTPEETPDEEKAILEELFTLSQEIEEMSREEKELAGEAQRLEGRIAELQEGIKDRQDNYDKQLKVLERVLASYQRRGPASFLETVLGSESLTDFLRSINIIRELSHNTGELLDSLEKEKAALLSEKENLKAHMEQVENKRTALKDTLAEKLRLKQEQEEYLSSLKEEQEHYREQLESVEREWEEIKVLFPQIVDEFGKLIQEGNLSLNDFDLSFDLFSVKGTITEEKINGVLERHSGLPKMVFDFSPGQVGIEIPDKHLTLTGTFTVMDKSSLKFEVSEGTFYGMKLETESIEELFKNGYLLIDLKELAGDITLKSVEMMDGTMEFMVNPFF
mgnify:CR=1 FL=1